MNRNNEKAIRSSLSDLLQSHEEALSVKRAELREYENKVKMLRGSLSSFDTAVGYGKPRMERANLFASKQDLGQVPTITDAVDELPDIPVLSEKKADGSGATTSQGLDSSRNSVGDCDFLHSLSRTPALCQDSVCLDGIVLKAWFQKVEGSSEAQLYLTTRDNRPVILG